LSVFVDEIQDVDVSIRFV